MATWYLWIITAILGGYLITHKLHPTLSRIEKVFTGITLGNVAWGYLGYTISYLSQSHNLITISTSSLIILATGIILNYRHILKQSTSSSVSLNHFKLKTLALHLNLFLAILYLSHNAFIYNQNGISTTFRDNYADLTLHLGITTQFLYNPTFPPQHPDLLAAPLSYPFLIDYHAAMLINTGLSISQAFHLQTTLFIYTISVLMFYLTLNITRSKISATLAVILLITAGGLGWIIFLKDLLSTPITSWGHLLNNLPQDYTNLDVRLRWVNPFVYWLIPMRSMLLGIPIVLICINTWYTIINTSSAKYSSNLIKLSIILSALLPLSHTHSLIILIIIATIFMIIYKPRAPWITYTLITLILTVPQIRILVQNNQITSSLRFIPGWQDPQLNAIVFWITNTGLFIPLLLISLFSSKIPNHIKKFTLPFQLLFLIANLISFTPWSWDNVKILAYWYIFSIPIITMLLYTLWKTQKAITISIIITLCFAGSLDIWRSTTLVNKKSVFSPAAMNMAVFIKTLPIDNKILAPFTINNPLLLTGRPNIIGYPGRVWSHGLKFTTQLDQVQTIYQGSTRSQQLIQDLNLDYILINTQTINNETISSQEPFNINTQFFRNNYQRVYKSENYELYQTPPTSI